MKSIAALMLLVVLASAQDDEVFIGSIRTLQHGVKGKVYALDEKTLLLKDFQYDGQGPDAFFWVGTSDAPGEVGNILPYPFKGKFFNYDSEDAPILKGAFDGSMDIKLTLPEGLNVSDLKWFSVWCRRFSVNFGDLIFPENLSFDKTTVPTVSSTSTTTTTTDLPPPLVHHDNTLDGHETDDGDVSSEPESEPEDHHHARHGAASSVVASSVVVVASYFVAKLLL